jgi:hypothetical protein
MFVELKCVFGDSESGTGISVGGCTATGGVIADTMKTDTIGCIKPTDLDGNLKI